MRRTLHAAALAVLALLGVPTTAAAADGAARGDEPVRGAVAAFVSRIAGSEIRDVIIDQAFTLYHPDGIQPASRGLHRIVIKPPGRQRIEETVEGRREVRLLTGGRTFVRRADGATFEAPPARGERSPTHLTIPLRHSADELLAAWRALGVRDDVSDTVSVAGRAVTVIGARAGDRESPAVWLDPERGVVRVVARETLPKGPALVDVMFSEHRPLRGAFLFPYRQEVFVDGRLAVLIVVRSVVANVDPPDALFDPEALRRER